MFRDLRTQLILWTILPLSLILVGAAYLGVNSHQNAMRDLVSERDGALAHVVAQQWSDALTSHANLLPTLDPRDEMKCDSACAAFDGGVALYDAKGQLVRAQPSTSIWISRQALSAPLLGAARPTFSPPFMEAQVIRVLTSVPLGDGTLVGAFAPPSLADLGFGKRGVAYVVDRNGAIIAHPDKMRLNQNMAGHAGILQVIRGEAGSAFHHDAQGDELVVGFAPIAPTGWGLIIEEPWAEVVEPMFQYAVLFPLIFLFVAIGALGAVYFGLRNIVRPLQNLAQAANKIAFGDYRAAERSVGGVHEIEELRETLDAMARQVRAAQDAMQSYITAITRGQEEERMRLARELHDDTVQSLIALQQRIEMAQRALTRDPAVAAAKLAELRTLVGDSLASVRGFVRDLRPTLLAELGLIPALETLTRESNASFEVIGEEQRLDAERELTLYRIVQEALRNIAKHARAKTAKVALEFTESEVTATIEDDGIGFAAPEAPAAYARAGHFGLMGMQERAQLFGGNVYVKSESGHGTRVIAYVPRKS